MQCFIHMECFVIKVPITFQVNCILDLIGAWCVGQYVFLMGGYKENALF